jgi:hypothetical protein
MHNLFLWVGRLAGLAGIVLCAAAFIARLQQVWTLGGYSIGSILQAGMAGLLLGCLAYLADLAERPRT